MRVDQSAVAPPGSLVGSTNQSPRLSGRRGRRTQPGRWEASCASGWPDLQSEKGAANRTSWWFSTNYRYISCNTSLSGHSFFQSHFETNSILMVWKYFMEVCIIYSRFFYFSEIIQATLINCILLIKFKNMIFMVGIVDGWRWASAGTTEIILVCMRLMFNEWCYLLMESVSVLCWVFIYFDKEQTSALLISTVTLSLSPFLSGLTL